MEDQRLRPVPESATLHRAAKLLGTSPETVRRMLENGEIRGFRFGRQHRVLIEDLRATIARIYDEAGLTARGGL